MSEKLEACPHCGGLVEYANGWYNTGKSVYCLPTMNCIKCGMVTNFGTYPGANDDTGAVKADVLSRFNTRAPDPLGVLGVLDEMRRFIEQEKERIKAL